MENESKVTKETLITDTGIPLSVYQKRLTDEKRKSFFFGAATGSAATFLGLTLMNSLGSTDDETYFEIVEDD